MAIDMNDSVCVPKAEYDDLIMKATLLTIMLKQKS